MSQAGGRVPFSKSGWVSFLLSIIRGTLALRPCLGIFIIFIWRIAAKSVLLKALPPLFRGLARIFSLPNRRFYTPATEYTSVPSEFSGDGGLRPIPSLIDLPSSAGIEIGGIGSGSEVTGYKSFFGEQEIKLRGNGSGNNGKISPGSAYDEKVHGSDWAQANGSAKRKKNKDGEFIKHYDADGMYLPTLTRLPLSNQLHFTVLTKVVVYAGIAILSSEVMPITFDALGWGLYSSYYPA
jgi:dihydrosphingosine 1-phosphate phosphatase